MNRLFTLTVLLLAVAGSACADNIDKTQVLQIASKFMNDHGMNVAGAKGANNVQSTASVAEATDGHYVINGDNSFVVVASDDAASQQVLGYSTSRTFDPENVPEGMKDFLRAYDQQMEYIKKYGVKPSAAQTKAVREDISRETPTWGQNEPYNTFCPTDENTGKTSVTGCVATAMSEIMYYHKWPARYDWGLMKSTYDSTTPAINGEAVAKLMHDAGVSVDMTYSSNSSSASDDAIRDALVNTFGYSEDAVHLQRGDYTPENWEQMVYDNLREYGPLQYSGTTTSGHAFVCDGYKDGYFHFNWGWDGLSNDAYFTLSSLTPMVEGTGGSEAHDYTALQTAVFNIHPADDGKTYTVNASDVPHLDKDTHFELTASGYYENVNTNATIRAVLKLKNPYDYSFCSDFRFLLADENFEPVVVGKIEEIDKLVEAKAGEEVTFYVDYPAPSAPGTYTLACMDSHEMKFLQENVRVVNNALSSKPELTAIHGTTANISINAIDTYHVDSIKVNFFQRVGTIIVNYPIYSAYFDADENATSQVINTSFDHDGNLLSGGDYAISVIAVYTDKKEVPFTYDGKEFISMTESDTDGINTAETDAQKSGRAVKTMCRNKVVIETAEREYDADGKSRK